MNITEEQEGIEGFNKIITQQEMKKVNSWKAFNKQDDRYHLNLRFGKLTVLEIYYDVSDKEFRFIVFNFGVSNKV